MAWRGEVEDGTGWGGLVASNAEKRAEARQAALEKDAQRYRKLRRGQHWSVVNGIGDVLCGDDLDAAVDAVPAVGAA